MVEKLPDIITPPNPGPLESVDELPSATTYYDGSLHLNVAQIDCHVISVPGDCVKQTVCGKKIKFLYDSLFHCYFFITIIKGGVDKLVVV